MHYNDCFKVIMCENATRACYFVRCEKCPGLEVLKDILTTTLDENDIDDVMYRNWISKPRTSLEKFSKSSSEFINEFCSNIKNLSSHAFIAKEQASFTRSLKESLEETEFLVICDFAENYAFVIQNAAPGFHWNNNQATIYPVVIYFKSQDELKHRSLVIISDCPNHDAVAVSVFSQIINDFIKTLCDCPSKIFYVSDGAPQQFKNFKNFVNLYYHEEDYGIDAEWHFSATAHGKGPCDGVGGTFKRIAARASLQLPYDQQITTTQELYEWASKPTNLPNILVKFSSQECYNAARAKLESRFINSKPIVGTQQIHCVIPDNNGSLKVKEYSASEEYRICKIFKRQRK